MLTHASVEEGLTHWPDVLAMYRDRTVGGDWGKRWFHGCVPQCVLDLCIDRPSERAARSLARAFTTAPLTVRPYDLIVGTAIELDFPVRDQERWQSPVPYAGGITAHMAISYDRLLAKGLRGIAAEVSQRLTILQSADVVRDATYFQREDFLIAGQIVLDAAIAYQRRLADEARRVGNPQAALLDRIPSEPPKTFHEALQAIYTVVALCQTDAGLMGLGRLDQVLWPYYEADLREGRLTRERALELLMAFSIQTSSLVNVPMSLMLAGRDRQGQPVCNELTRLFLEAGDRVRLHNPALGLAMNSQTPDDVLAMASRMVSSGYGHPAFFNDDVIIDGLTQIGVSAEEARWHLHCTCTEMTPCGCSGIWVVADYLNFAAVMQQMCADEAFSPTTFDDVLAYTRKGLQKLIYDNAERMNIYAETRRAQSAFPFLSLFVEDCLAREQDIERGGAKYYYFYPQLVGLPTVIDSLTAIQTLVFDDKSLSFAEFAAIVRNNFGDAETLRHRIRNTLPKYGTNHATVDALAGEFIDFYIDELKRYRNPYGFTYQAGFLSWIMHSVLGKHTGATPDGRLAGQAISDSLAAAAGMAKKGPTAMLETVEKFDLRRAIGAVVVNVTIPVGQVDDKLTRAVADMIRTHFAKGGFELQFNVMNRELLEAARKQPEQYRDLMVRVGGYSDYFVMLNEELKDEIIARFI